MSQLSRMSKQCSLVLKHLKITRSRTSSPREMSQIRVIPLTRVMERQALHREQRKIRSVKLQLRKSKQSKLLDLEL